MIKAMRGKCITVLLMLTMMISTLSVGMMTAKAAPIVLGDLVETVGENEPLEMTPLYLFGDIRCYDMNYWSGFSHPSDGMHTLLLYENGGFAYEYYNDEYENEDYFYWLDNSTYTFIPDNRIIFQAANAGTYTFHAMIYDAYDSETILTTRTIRITVVSANTAPTDIALSGSTVSEDTASVTVIGTFSTTDTDVGDTFTYSLVSGEGSTDNGLFIVDGNALKLNATLLDYEAKTSLSIRVRTTDAAYATFEKAFTITVTDVYEPPVLGTNATLSLTEDAAPTAISGSHLETAVNAGLTATYTLTAVPAKGTLKNNSVTIGTDGTFTQADIDANRLTYTANANETGADSFIFSVSDGTNTITGQTFNITITAVNDAPVLMWTAPSFAGINAAQANNSGQTVASLVGTLISDADSGALEGIAIIGTSSGNGGWQYSTDGTTWFPMGTVSHGASLLLRDIDYVRFVPNGSDATTASITYRAWDQTSGLYGGTADTTTNGGSTAFSTAVDTAGITVSAAPAVIQSASVPSNGTYGVGQTLDFTINYNKAVTVTGVPRLAITVGIDMVYAAYVSGSGTPYVVFRYTVALGQADNNGISLGSLALNGGSIQALGIDAELTLNNVGSTTSVLVDGVAPTVTDANISISGGSGFGGAFKIGDTVTATWNNTAAGDNNSDISGVTVDFSQFGVGGIVAATDSGGIWTATYTIVPGSISAANRNVSVSVTDYGGNGTTTADTTNAMVDNVAPTVTDAAISISGATGSGGVYKVGDTVTATWNNTSSGDNNSDISGVTVDFSQFGGDTAVAAVNYLDAWVAAYTIVPGSITTANRNVLVTATDNSGNTTTAADTTNATVDSVAPTVTDASISISGGSGDGGAYRIGDTVIVTWDNTADGDNNSDISGITVDVSQFGGGNTVAAVNSSDTWTAMYTIVQGGISAANRNVSVTATDNSGNTTTTADTTNAMVDNTVLSAPTIALSASSDTGMSSSDGITNDATPAFSGTAEAGSTVTLYDGVLVIGTTTADGSGNWTITSSALSEEAHGITAIATDAAGNASAASAALNINVDGQAPTLTVVPLNGAAGVATSGDIIITFDEAIDDSAPGTVQLDGAFLTGGAWNPGKTVYAVPYSGLAQNHYTALDISSFNDVAGNGIASVNYSFTTIPDTAAPVLSLGAVNRTSDTSATVSFTSNEAGAYYFGVAEDGAGAPVIDTSGAGTACGTGETAISLTTLTAGAKDIYIKVKDASGNVSDALKMDIASYLAPDTTAPILTAGASNRLSDTAATVAFTSDEAGAYYIGVVDDGAGAPVIDTSGAGTACGTGETIINLTTLTAGAKDVYIQVKDASGNVSDALKMDIASYLAPDTTAPILTAGASNRLSDTAATVAFTSDEAGVYYIGVVDDGAGAPVIDTSGAGTACGTGETIINLTTLTAGAKDIYIQVKDAAGNVSEALKIDIPIYFVPVTGISDVPATATVGSNLTLTGTVIPADSTNQSILWSVKSAGGTGAIITGNTLSATGSGTATVTATIANGTLPSVDYTQDFNITVYLMTYGMREEQVESTTVTAEGLFAEEAALIVVPIDAGETDRQELEEQMEGKDVLAAFEVSIEPADAFQPPLTLTFQVDAKYNGRTVYILHRLSNGDMEIYTPTVQDGAAVITVNQLSPFLLAADPAVVITAQPQSVTALVGETASFHVLAEGTEPITYRWQRRTGVNAEWEDIPGATRPDYTTTRLNKSHNGYQYRVIIGDGLGNSVTSEIAVLTVTASPDTGDDSQPLVYAGLTVLFAGLAILLLRKRRMA